MNDGRCHRCGKSLAGRVGSTRFCSDQCRKRWSKAGGGLVRDSEATILAEQRKLEGATYASTRCRCEHPLGLVDADGEVRCFKCARPAEVSGPPGNVPAAA